MAVRLDTGDAANKPIPHVRVAINDYKKRGHDFWTKVVKLDKSKRSFEVDLDLFNSGAIQSDELSRIQTAGRASIDKAEKQLKNLQETHTEILNRLKALPSETGEKLVKRLAREECKLRILLEHMNTRLPKARLSLASLENANTTLVYRGLSYVVGWAFGASNGHSESKTSHPPRSLSDAGLKSVDGSADSKVLKGKAHRSLSDKGPTPHTGKTAQRRMKEKLQDQALAPLKQTSEKYHSSAISARKTVLELEGAKRNWEMLRSLWDLHKPKLESAETTLKEAGNSYSNLISQFEDYQKTLEHIGETLKARPADPKKKELEIWEKIENDQKTLQVVCNHIGKRKKLIAQSLQSLTDYDAYRVTRAAKYILGLTPDIPSKTSTNEADLVEGIKKVSLDGRKAK